MTTTRLIEKWLPIAALGEESVRERRSMTALPPVYYLHVWWARRPLVASRAAVLSSLLPADADRNKFLHVLGIHGDPVAARKRIVTAKRSGEDLGANVYGYPRAFSYLPTEAERQWIRQEAERAGSGVRVLDPTAGGGSIPFEAIRLGLDVDANDLNPVATLILQQTCVAPHRFGSAIAERFDALARAFLDRATPRVEGLFPVEQGKAVVDGYLWARTVRCPHCEGVVPLSPNWRLGSEAGVRLVPDAKSKRCQFKIVATERDQSPGTVKSGAAKCPFPSCGRVIEGDEVKRQAQAGEMGDQMYAVALSKPVESRTKTGRSRIRWERQYRAASAADEVLERIAGLLEAKRVEWDVNDVLPSEVVPPGLKTSEPLRYGFARWRDMFNARQLIGHGTSVEVYRELLAEAQQKGSLDEVDRAAFIYLSFALDKLLNYNSRLCRWDSSTGRVRSVFDTHNLAFVWSYAEMAPVGTGEGFSWALGQTRKCIAELIELMSGTDGAQTGFFAREQRADARVSNVSADALTQLADGCVDAVIMDPPYGANVMYAELADFFYVWLKRTAGYVHPELFRQRLTEKEREAVANASKYAGQPRADVLANREYQERMAAIFSECRRVMKSDGVLTVMFMHKATEAWDALASGLIQAGFAVTASWPVNTEAEASLHIREKSAANSTVFLACRPRSERATDEITYWEDVEPRVAGAVRARVQEYQKAGITGVDLYLACFGPALEEFAKYWPLKRGNPRPVVSETGGRSRRRHAAAAADADPYAVTPEDALDAARREVKKWRLDRLLRSSRHPDLDAVTEWFVLAWDAFRAPEFPYDEALRLARVVGLDLDRDLVGHVCEKDGSDIILWDSATRAAKHALGPADGSETLLDALHHAAHRARAENVGAARELLAKSSAEKQPAFHAALAAVLEVLPVSSTFTHVEGEKGLVAEASNDFDALEKLRRLAYAERVPEPEQLSIWADAPEAKA